MLEEQQSRPDAENGMRSTRHHLRVPQGPTTTITLPGPWTPSVSVSSMSAVRLGPVTTMQLDALAIAPAALGAEAAAIGAARLSAAALQ